ncbi:MAG: hypothetical protein V4731_02905 [Pseudomonadota bacterium]
MTTAASTVNPVNPGQVVWAGENPGIYLKDAEGNWQALALYFRVVTSPFGPGRGAVVLGDPFKAAGWPTAGNVCVHDNEPLMRWLVSDFVSRFLSFKGAAGLAAMHYQHADSMQTHGDGSFHEETLQGGGVSVALRWKQLGKPFAVDVPPAMSATGEHQMYSVFVEAQAGSIRLNGETLQGKVIERDFLGRRMSTAFLAFNETWVSPAKP